MILKRKQLTPLLIEALDVVAKIEMETALAYNVKRLKRKIGQAFEETREIYTKKVRSFLVLDEAGNPLCEKDAEGNPIPGKWTYNTPDFEKEIKEFEEKFVEEEVTIKSFPITLSSLEHAKISADVLDYLEPILFVEGDAELDS